MIKSIINTFIGLAIAYSILVFGLPLIGKFAVLFGQILSKLLANY